MPNPLHSIGPFHQALNGQAVEKPTIRNNTEKLENACNEFEALFVKYMMQQMRETIPENGLIGQSQAQKIYTGMLDDEVAKSVSHGRGLGLAKAMYEQMAAIHGDDPKKK